MKSSTLTMSLALLVGTFMWGCQEQGSGPVGPDGLVPQFAKPTKPDRCPGHPSCSGEDAIALVTMSGGMVGDGAQRMAIREKKREFRMNTNEGDVPYFGVRMNLISTDNAGRNLQGDIRYDDATGTILKADGNELCSQRGDDAPFQPVAERLFDKLVQGFFDLSRVIVNIDTPVLTNGSGSSEDHRIHIFGGVLGQMKVIGAPTVTIDEGGVFTPANFTATFTGGDIELAGSKLGTKNTLYLTCHIQVGDEITLVAVAP